MCVHMFEIQILTEKKKYKKKTRKEQSKKKKEKESNRGAGYKEALIWNVRDVIRKIIHST